METVAWDLARALAAGAPVALATTRIPGAPEQFTREGVAVTALPEAPPGRYSAAWWRGTRRLYRERFAGRVAGVISVSAGGFALLDQRGTAAREPFVMQAHGTTLRDAVSAWRRCDPRAWAGSLRSLLALPRDLRAYRRFDRIVAVGPAIAAALQRPPVSWTLAPEKVVMIHNGIDATRFHPDSEQRRLERARLGLRDGDLVVLLASRLHRQKGVFESLAGFARFAAGEPRARLLIVGDGPARPALQRAAAAARLDARVLFAGARPHAEMPAAYRAADLFLFTTRHPEGAPLGILEALASGLPAVVSRHLLAHLPAEPAVRGIPPRDPEAIAAALAAQRALTGTGLSWLPENRTLAAAAGAYAALLAGVRAEG
jgi:glycosyltransferase involved in cell wall biosynthesis